MLMKIKSRGKQEVEETEREKRKGRERNFVVKEKQRC